MAARWHAKGQDSFKRALLILSAGAPLLKDFKIAYSVLLIQGNSIPSDPKTKKKLLCKTYVDLLKAPTQDSVSIKRDIRMRVIESTKWNIGFVRNIACENRWRTDDADVHMPPRRQRPWKVSQLWPDEGPVCGDDRELRKAYRRTAKNVSTLRSY